MKTLKIVTSSLSAAAIVFSSAVPAMAAETVVVTSKDLQGWSTAETSAGGSVEFVEVEGAPGGQGALQLSTDGTNAAKAQLMHEADTKLADVNELSYYTFQNKASSADGNASYQLVVDLNGGAEGGTTTLVYEPYWNDSEENPVTSAKWQKWDVDAGQFWSSRTVTVEGSDCAVQAGGGGSPFYTLADLSAKCPDAKVLAFGANIGTYNPDYDVYVDLVSFNGIAYDFDIASQASADKDLCKKGGFQGLSDAKGKPFRNQGQCVSYFNHVSFE